MLKFKLLLNTNKTNLNKIKSFSNVFNIQSKSILNSEIKYFSTSNSLTIKCSKNFKYNSTLNYKNLYFNNTKGFSTKKNTENSNNIDTPNTDKIKEENITENNTKIKNTNEEAKNENNENEGENKCMNVFFYLLNINII